MQIVGIVKTGYRRIWTTAICASRLPSAQRLLQSDRVTNLVVGLDATENTDVVCCELAPASPRPARRR